MKENIGNRIAQLLWQGNEKSSIQTFLMVVSGISLFILLTFPLISSRIKVFLVLIINILLLIILVGFVFIFHLKQRLIEKTTPGIRYAAFVISLFLVMVFVILAGMRIMSIINHDLIQYNTIKTCLLSLPCGDLLYALTISGVLVWVLVTILGILSFGLLYVFFKKLLHLIRLTIRGNGKKAVVLFGLSSVIWIFLPLLTLYSTNVRNVSLLFVMVLAIVYMILTFLVYLTALGIFQSPVAGFVFCVICWIGLSISYPLFMETGIDWNILVIFLSLLLLITIAGILGYYAKKTVAKFNINVSKIAKYVLFFVLVLAIIGGIMVVPALTSTDVSSNEAVFITDANVSHPNIYWIHGESMLDPAVLTKYWGVNSNLSNVLESKRFVVNPNAYLTGVLSGRTSPSLSSLFSPMFYDTYGNMTDVKSNLVYSGLENNELIRAFETGGYYTASIIWPSDVRYINSPSKDRYVYSNTDLFVLNRTSERSLLDDVLYYDYEMENEFVEYSAFLLYTWVEYYVSSGSSSIMWEYLPSNAQYGIHGYFNETEKEKILNGTDWLTVEGYGSLLDAFMYVLDESEYPQLVLVYPNLAHVPYNIDENGSLFVNGSSEDLALYPQKYSLSEKILVYLIGVIQEKDPESIIVVVGDHGPHITTSDDRDIFSIDPQNLEYEHHVLSAIYIPEQYQTPDFKNVTTNPRNIVRYLVNTFVGQNYEYLPVEDYY